MGEPAVPTEAERLATLDLAREVVENVRNDEALSPFIANLSPAAQTLVFQLALELVTRVEEVKSVRNAWRMAEDHVLLLTDELALARLRVEGSKAIVDAVTAAAQADVETRLCEIKVPRENGPSFYLVEALVR